jgi:hypothetical protein
MTIRSRRRVRGWTVRSRSYVSGSSQMCGEATAATVDHLRIELLDADQRVLRAGAVRRRP